MEKYFCFRFDVDTHRCLQKGAPNLIKLGKETNVHFTFFVNMGRAVSRISYIKKIIHKNSNKNPLIKLSNLKKLGMFDYFIASVFNPSVGGKHFKILKSLQQAGHEIGLHGGSNHALWQSEAAAWTKGRVEKEITASFNKLLKAGISAPVGFSSPGWQTPKNIIAVLEKLNFQYLADTYGDDLQNVNKMSLNSDIRGIPANIVGEGGVGYIEYLRAKQMHDDQIINDFKERLKNKTLAVAYDHPFYAGIQELKIIKNMIEAARYMGFKIKRLQDVL